MEAIINFWNYLKTILQVKLGFISTAIDRRMTRRPDADMDESRFYLNDQKEDGERDNSMVNHLTAIPKPGIYLSWTDAATNGCLLGQNDDGPGLYY
jgi:hypothetical protein